MAEGIAGRRFVLAPYGSAGDVYPFLWLGSELHRQGASVVVVASPVFSKAAKESALRLIPVGTEQDFHRLAGDSDFWHPLLGPWRVLGAAKEWFEPLSQTITKLLRPPHSALISSAPNFPATFAARKLRKPHLTVHLQPVALFSAVATPLLGFGFGWFRKLPHPLKKRLFHFPTPVDWVMRPTLKKVCREAGIPAPRSLFRDWWDSPHGVLCLFPEWFAPPQSDWPRPLYQSDFPLFDPLENRNPEFLELMKFLKGGEKPLVFTAGSAMGCPTDFFTHAADAVSKLGCRAVFVTAYPEKLSLQLPANIFIVRYASFSKLFPLASATIHHGGIGTTAQAFAAGVPQLLIPHSHDQPDNAERVSKLGCGLALPISKLNAERLAKNITILTKQNSFRERAAEISRKLPAPGTATDATPAICAIARFLDCSTH